MTGIPLVSIVVPLYQKADSVRQTLGCALRQTFADFEVIVVDDGSKDGGGDLVAAIADPRIILIRQTNQGVSAARNRAIREARGTWIAFLDADDLWSNGHLGSLVRAVSKPEAAGVQGAFGNAIRESQDRAIVSPTVPSQRVDRFFAFAREAGGYPISTSATLFRRAALIDAGLFAPDVSMGEDIDMWCKLALQGDFMYVASPTALYRDKLPSSSLARVIRTAPIPPLFSRTLRDREARGLVPARHRRDARRYANFLMLEYVRQLLDRGDAGLARRVILSECSFFLDPMRFSKRLARTWPTGQMIFALVRGSGGERKLTRQPNGQH